jgi:hypothetical protein
VGGTHEAARQCWNTPGPDTRRRLPVTSGNLDDGGDRWLDGFDADPDGTIELPAERDDVTLSQRRRAALLVMAISQQCTPEEVIAGVPDPWVLERFEDEGEMAEAMTFVDLLANALFPRAAV